MVCLKNEWIRMDLDERARIIWLEDLKSGNGNIIAEPMPICRAAILRTFDELGTGENKEDIAFTIEQDISVDRKDEVVEITVQNLKTQMGEKRAHISLTIKLDGPEVVFGGQVVNESDSCVNELIYPCVGGINSLGNGAPDLLYPRQCGERINDICKELKGKQERERLHEISETYPGHLSMSWMALTDENNTLYMACYDELFHVMTLRAKGSDMGSVSLEFNKMCFVKKGEKWKIPTMVIRLYQGSWRMGAEEYVKWSQTWRHPIKPTEWMRKSNGYFLTINKQQYGYESWPYDTLPELYKVAQAHGCDCLGLFGWYHTGHDNNYPNLDVSPTMGGEEGLKASIKAVQEEGGHVTLYYQGHLMDLESPFYKQEGEKWESKNIWGTPYYEFYPKYCYSDVLRHFSKKVFSTICPSVERWHDMMADRIDWVAQFGSDGALYDQIGGMPPYLCFNEKHQHVNGKPSLSYTQGRLRLLPRIRERVAKYPNFAFMSEHVTDLYSQFLDCVHGIGSHPYARAIVVEGDSRHVKPSGVCMMPQLFRYCFPDTMITVRNPKPYMEKRMTNYAFEFGFKFEMELRYDVDQKFVREDQASDLRVYAKKVADLRRRYEDYLLLGTFCADEGIEYANLLANSYVSVDGSCMIALWNDSEHDIKPVVILEEGEIVSWSTIDRDGDGLMETLSSNEIAVLKIRNKQKR